MPQLIPLLFTACATLQPETGFFQFNVPNRLATEGFYLADDGSSLELMDTRYRFAVATYSLEFPEKYLHTYDYAPEQIWGTYRGNLREDAYCKNKYIFKESCYFRVAARRVDRENITIEEAAGLSSTLIFSSTAEKRQPRVFEQEVESAAHRINTLREPGDLVLAILTDTHMTVNGTWQDTAANLLALQQKARLDGLVHLGDLTDGTVSRQLTCRYVQSMLQDMHKLEVPVHIVLGNHDANYFHGNRDVFSLHEQAALYQTGAEQWKQDRDKTYYYADCPQQKLRCLFLSAYDNEARPRYGFDLTQIAWVRETLKGTPESWRILLFSHDAPLPELDPWSEEIRNGALLLKALDNSKAQILACIHGHAHADLVHRWQGKKSFPIISIGCAKCEDMSERKVEGSFTPARVLGEASQELWDILIIKDNGKLHFVRFGAGRYRSV